jgi:uncharacterized glyoxalase superfamily protein PhnB
MVKDVVLAHDYYSNKLGFRAPRMWGDPPGFCIASRDGMCVMLDQVEGESRIEPNSRFGRWDAYFWVQDVDALHAEFTAKGADIVSEPENKFYDMREFMVRDVDGYTLCFGQDSCQ